MLYNFVYVLGLNKWCSSLFLCFNLIASCNCCNRIHISLLQAGSCDVTQSGIWPVSILRTVTQRTLVLMAVYFERKRSCRPTGQGYQTPGESMSRLRQFWADNAEGAITVSFDIRRPVEFGRKPALIYSSSLTGSTWSQWTTCLASLKSIACRRSE